MHKLLTLNGGSGMLLLGLGRTPDLHFAKSEETTRRWSHVSFPCKEKKNLLGGTHLNVWKDRLQHINVGNGEQLSTWPDGNWMDEPDLNEGQEIKQGGVMSSQKVWDSLQMAWGKMWKPQVYKPGCLCLTLVPGTSCNLNPPSLFLYHRS